MHSISILASSDIQATTTEQPSLARPNRSIPRYENLPKGCSAYKDTFGTNSKEMHSFWYHGYFGSVDIRVKSTSISTSKSRRTGNRAVSEEKIIKVTPNFSRKTLELRLLSSFSHVSRTLRTYPILGYDALFYICSRGNLGDLQATLSSRTISPFVTDNDGWSLLHVRLDSGPKSPYLPLIESQYAAIGGNLDTCGLLLQLGVDSDIVDSSGR